MKNFEIAITDTVNVKWLTKILNELTAAGCHITIKGSNFFVEYNEELENQVATIFDINSLQK
jgi:hypothetical protein